MENMTSLTLIARALNDGLTNENRFAIAVKNHYLDFKYADTNEKRLILIQEEPELTQYDIINTYLACIAIIEYKYLHIEVMDWVYNESRYCNHGGFFGYTTSGMQNLSLEVRLDIMRETNSVFYRHGLYIGKSLFDEFLA